MKKLIALLLILSAVAPNVKAQTSQGSLMFGGGIRYTSENDESGFNDVKTNTFSFFPSAGYFVADNFAVGLTLEITSSNTDNGPTTTKSSIFHAGPFVRYYKFTSNEKFAFLGEAGFLFGGTKNGDLKGSSFTFYVSPGFTYFFTDRWAMELQLEGISYQSEDPNKDADDDKEGTFTFGIDSFRPQLGIRYYIGK